MLFLHVVNKLLLVIKIVHSPEHIFWFAWKTRALTMYLRTSGSQILQKILRFSRPSSGWHFFRCITAACWRNKESSIGLWVPLSISRQDLMRQIPVLGNFPRFTQQLRIKMRFTLRPIPMKLQLPFLHLTAPQAPKSTCAKAIRLILITQKVFFHQLKY